MLKTPGFLFWFKASQVIVGVYKDGSRYSLCAKPLWQLEQSDYQDKGY